MKRFLCLFFVAAFAITGIAPAAEREDLYPAEVHPVDEIVVHSYRDNVLLGDAPNKVEIITGDDIRSTRAFNLTDALKNNVNVQAVDLQGLTGGVDMRGFAPTALGTNSYTRLLVDGMPFSTRNTAAASLVNVSSIEVLKGPFSSIYGSGAMGGIVNILTPRTKGRIRGGGSIGYGSFNTFTASTYVGGSISSRVDFDLYGDFYKQNKDYRTGGDNLLKMTPYEKEVMDPASYSAVYNNSKYDKKAAGARLGIDISDSWRLNIYDDFYYTGNAMGNGGFWGIEDQTDKKVVRNAARMDATGNMGRHTLKIAPFFSFENSDYDNAGMWGNTSSRYDYLTYGGQVSDIIRLGKHSLTVGVDNFSQKYVSRQWDGNGDRTAPFNPDYTNIQTGVFAEGKLSFFDDKLTSVMGVRYDNIAFRTFSTAHLDMEAASKNYNTFNPNLGVKYKVTRNVSVRGSVGTAYLAPDAFKMTGTYYVGGAIYRGNPDLKPEKSLTYDLGIGLADNRRSVMADVTIFFTDHKNLIVSDYSQAEYTTFANANKAKLGGLEYMFSADLGRMFDKHYSLRLYASFTHIFRSEVETATGKGPREYISRNTANFGLSYGIEKFSLRVNGRYIGEKIEGNFICAYDPLTWARVPFVMPDGHEVRPGLVDDAKITIPDFMVFDIYADYDITQWMSLGIKLGNVLNENYFERDSYYMPGRNFSIIASFKF